jgi:hypothetical protein
VWRVVVFAERTRGAHWFDSIRIMSKMRGPNTSYNRTMGKKKPHPSILKVTRIDNGTDPVVSPCATIQLQSAEAAHPNPKRSYVPPHFPEPKPPRNPAQAWGSTHEWCCQLYAQLHRHRPL